MSELKPYHFFLPIAFLVLLILPYLNDQLQFSEYERQDENRTFIDSIQLDLSNLDVLPENVDTYLNDNFSFRGPLLDVFHNLKYYVLNVSPKPDKVIIGEDGWYFNADKEQKIFEGKEMFSPEELDSFSSEWRSRIHYLDSLNIKPYWVIAPMKHHIYTDKLPYYIVPIKENRAEKLKKRLNKDFPGLIIDVNSQLIKAKDSVDVFYKFDNHWNFQAGEIVASQILKRIKNDFPEYNIGNTPEIKWRDSTRFHGIQAQRLAIKKLSETVKEPLDEGFSSLEIRKYNLPGLDGFGLNEFYELGYSNDSLAKGLKILIIRDSFGDQIAPFMRDSFKESLWIFDAWRYGLNKDIIELMKPDLILFLGLEVHLDGILSNIE